MTQEEKQLLFKDLCARLPYGVKLRYVEDLVVKKESHVITLNNIYLEHILNGDADIKPYLRPMSSMTEEETDEYDRLVMCNASWVVDDWLNKNHFDYRRLILAGLALEAPNDMYKNEQNMTQEEFQNNVKELKNSLVKTTEEYIKCNKQYNNGDILKISFIKDGKKFVYKCMIVNIYLKPDMEFMSTMQWPTPTIWYFARNCWKNEDGVIELGGHCPLGYLEGSENICGHIGIDMDTVKIEVINMNDL